MNQYVDWFLRIFGAGSFISILFALLWNRSRKQASVGISKTEGEIYKDILERRLTELNIQEIIEKKVEHEVAPLKEMLWNREKEHYEVKSEMQKRLANELQEKEILIRENEMLHLEIGNIRQDYTNMQLQFNQIQKEVEQLKTNKNGH